MKRRTRKKWTTDDDNTLIAMRKEGKTYKQVARKLKCSRNAVATRVTKLRNKHGDDIIHRGGVRQARVKLKAERRNARVTRGQEIVNSDSHEWHSPTDRSGRGHVTPPPREGVFTDADYVQLTAECEKLSKRRDELLAELTEVGRQLANTRLEVDDKNKQLKSQARHIIELASEQAKLRNIIIEMVAERYSGE